MPRRRRATRRLAQEMLVPQEQERQSLWTPSQDQEQVRTDDRCRVLWLDKESLRRVSLHFISTTSYAAVEIDLRSAGKIDR